MILRTTLLLATITPSLVQGLSAHSPIDLEAYPAYSISLNQHEGILNETLQELLHEQLETPPGSFIPPQRHFLRTPSGQGFLCTVPSVTLASNKRQQRQAELDEHQRRDQRQRGLERGLALLEPMRAGCIYLKQNWFTYSFCYGSEIRQFHEVRIAGSPAPREDPNSEAYVLGHAPEPAQSRPPPTNPKKQFSIPTTSSEIELKEPMIPSRLGGGDGMGFEEGGRYLSQVWEGGTICDKTGLPRSVEVQFHCNTQTIDRIALIRETSICRYVLLIHTPRLCAEPLFLEGADRSLEPPATIECRPVVQNLPVLPPQQEEEETSQEKERSERESIGSGIGEEQNEMVGEGESKQGDQQDEIRLHDIKIEPPQPPNSDGTTLNGIEGGVEDIIDVSLVVENNPETGELELVVEAASIVERGEGESEVNEKEAIEEFKRRFEDRTKDRNDGGGNEKQVDEEQITHESLQEMIRLMKEALTDALEDPQRSKESQEFRQEERERPRLHSRDEIRDMLNGFKQFKFEPELAKGSERDREPESMNEHEEFKQGFAKMYDRRDTQVVPDEEEDESTQSSRPRDEL